MPRTHAFPAYIPTYGEQVRLSIPELSTSSSIVTYVTYREGGGRKQKVLFRCMVGPNDGTGSIQVLWKPSTGWSCWMLGKPYRNVRVERV